jgi:hypothetical protein
MKFTQAPDDTANTGCHRMMVSENGLIWIGIYVVMFGFRVRAGFTRDLYSCSVIDYCAGDSPVHVELLYSMTHAILSKREENDLAFDGMPERSEIKPYFNDPDFQNWIVENSKDNYVRMDIGNLSEMRRKTFEKLWT